MVIQKSWSNVEASPHSSQSTTETSSTSSWTFTAPPKTLTVRATDNGTVIMQVTVYINYKDTRYLVDLGNLMLTFQPFAQYLSLMRTDNDYNSLFIDQGLYFTVVQPNKTATTFDTSRKKVKLSLSIQKFKIFYLHYLK